MSDALLQHLVGGQPDGVYGAGPELPLTAPRDALDASAYRGKGLVPSSGWSQTKLGKRRMPLQQSRPCRTDRRNGVPTPMVRRRMPGWLRTGPSPLASHS